MKNVCQGCTDRHPDCWGSCHKYLEALAEHKKTKQARVEYFKRNDMIGSIHYTGAKYERNRKKGG